MTIGELATAAGVRISTLRFYERRGLLTPSARTAAGYRQFTADDVARVRFMRRAQVLGFGLAELALLLGLSARRTIRRHDVVALGATKIAEIDQRIADLQRMRRAIAGLLAQPCLDLDGPCPIIASLAAPARSTRTSARKLPHRPSRVR
jgi:MerR family mercuric resistance operon transcriptional regulator